MLIRRSAARYTASIHHRRAGHRRQHARAATGQDATSQGTTGTPGQLPGAEGISSPKAQSFHGNVTIGTATAKMRLVQIAEEIIAVLVADPDAEVKISVEIQATFAGGAKDQTKRVISENTKTLGIKNADWE